MDYIGTSLLVVAFMLGALCAMIVVITDDILGVKQRPVVSHGVVSHGVVSHGVVSHAVPEDSDESDSEHEKTT